MKIYDIKYSIDNTKINKLVIVAHPDDESIFAGDILDQNTYIICVTDGNYHNNRNIRLRELTNISIKTGSKFEFWDKYPNKHWKDKNEWNISIQNECIDDLINIFEKFSNIENIYTHNEVGEYGHIDHIMVNKIVKCAYLKYYKNKIKIPKLYKFFPLIDLNNDILDANKLSKNNNESVKHKELLDLYESQDIDGFRNIYPKMKEVILLKNNNEYEDIDFYKVVNFWNRYSDRKFTKTLYPVINKDLLSKSRSNILEIGVEYYNYLNKEFFSNNVNYVQLDIKEKEHKDIINQNNDEYLECSVLDVVNKYPEKKENFDIITSFGVLGYFCFSNEDIIKYIENVYLLLKPNGLFFLKIDIQTMKKCNDQIKIDEHFKKFTQINKYFNFNFPHKIMDSKNNVEYILYLFKKESILGGSNLSNKKNATIVTAYFEVNKSKQRNLGYKDESIYKEWMKGILSYNGPMIIFSDKKNSNYIESLRGSLPTKMIIKEIAELETYKYYGNFNHEKGNYIEYLKDLDYNELYIIYNSRVSLVKEASILNPFNTKYFLWYDIGYLRNNQVLPKEWPNEDKLKIMDDKLLFYTISLKDIRCKSDYIDNHDYYSNPSNGISITGGFFGGTKKNILKLYDLYYKTLNELKNNGHFIGNDQTIYGKVYCDNSDLFTLIEKGTIHPMGNNSKNAWFHMVPYFL